MTHKQTLVASWLMIVVSALAFAACGGDDDDRAPNADATTTTATATTAPAGGVPPVVYESRIDNVMNIFTIDVETGETTQVTRGTGFDGNPGWSPDYTKIVFVSDRDRGARDNEIYTVNADGSDPRRITNSRIETYTSPKFSPDGRQIVATMRQQGEYYIVVMRPDGTGARPLTGAYRFAEFPAWGPGGEEVFFSAIETEGVPADIFAVNVQTSEVRTIVASPNADVCPHFTRDGRYMTYASSPRDEPGGAFDLYKHDLSSSDTTGASDELLLGGPPRDDYANPSPDATVWVFVTDRDGQNELYLMDPDGANQRRLTNTPNARENVPDW